MTVPTIPAFVIGSLYCTPTVMDLSTEHPVFQTFVRQCVRRHLACDWGDTDPSDRVLNDRAITDGSRIFSVFHISDKMVATASSLWIITESDRSHTTILFPFEY